MSYNFLVYIKEVWSYLYYIYLHLYINDLYDLYEIGFEKQIVLSIPHLAI